MKKPLFLSALFIFLGLASLSAADPPPVVGLCIAAPRSSSVDQFIKFMEEELGPGGINTLVLRVDYNFAYESYPELRDDNPLSREQVKSLLECADKQGIRIIPQINLLGHQSWHSSLGKLLEVYPEFDETPSVKLPESGTYEWPNDDGLYCKSYCPLHPDVHEVVFNMVNEIMEVFEADAFHAGLDEVFYIGMDECPRCNGKDKAKLFADEVNLISRHLQREGRELWMWGDRLIDGLTTGMGMWEASENDTHEALYMIDKDVVICDWHYERADPSAVLFAMNGLRVITCPWRSPDITRSQLHMTDAFRANTREKQRDLYYGFMQTVWSPAESFLEEYYSADESISNGGQVGSLKAIMEHYKQ